MVFTRKNKLFVIRIIKNFVKIGRRRTRNKKKYDI